MSSPDRTEECVQIAHELYGLCDSRGELELELPARVRQIGYLLELDDLAGSDVALETLERLAADSHDPRAQAYVPLERSRRMALEGSFAEAEQLTAEAGRLAADLRDSTIPMQTAAQVVGMRWAQGRMGEMHQQLKRFAEGYPAMPVFRAALALACCETGRDADARRELRLLAERDFEGVPRDNVWLLAMALLSETCARLEDASAAEVLYRLFAPFDGRNVTSPDAIFAGPVARYLGLSRRPAATGGRRAPFRRRVGTGEPRFARPAMAHAAGSRTHAAGAGRQGGAGPSAPVPRRGARTRGRARAPGAARVDRRGARGPGEAPVPPEQPAAEPRAAGMQREGEVWRFDLAAASSTCATARESNPRGAAERARSRDRAIDAEARAGQSGDGAVAADAPAAADAGLAVQASANTALVGLDATAKDEYRRRLEDLREEVEQAEAWRIPSAPLGRARRWR